MLSDIAVMRSKALRLDARHVGTARRAIVVTAVATSYLRTAEGTMGRRCGVVYATECTIIFGSSRSRPTPLYKSDTSRHRGSSTPPYTPSEGATCTCTVRRRLVCVRGYSWLFTYAQLSVCQRPAASTRAPYVMHRRREVGFRVPCYSS